MDSRYWELPKKLPRPDQYGNYYLIDKPLGPSIFISTIGCLVAGEIRKPRWIASLGHDGMLWIKTEYGKELVKFDSVQEAFTAIREAMTGKGECEP